MPWQAAGEGDPGGKATGRELALSWQQAEFRSIDHLHPQRRFPRAVIRSAWDPSRAALEGVEETLDAFTSPVQQGLEEFRVGGSWGYSLAV